MIKENTVILSLTMYENMRKETRNRENELNKLYEDYSNSTLEIAKLRDFVYELVGREIISNYHSPVYELRIENNVLVSKFDHVTKAIQNLAKNYELNLFELSDRVMIEIEKGENK